MELQLNEIVEYCQLLGIPIIENQDSIHANMKKPSAEESIFLTFYAIKNASGKIECGVGGKTIEHTGSWIKIKEKLFVQKTVWYDN